MRFKAAAAVIALSLAACSAAEGSADPIEPNAVNTATAPPPQPVVVDADADAGPEIFLMGDIDTSVAE